MNSKEFDSLDHQRDTIARNLPLSEFVRNQNAYLKNRSDKESLESFDTYFKEQKRSSSSFFQPEQLNSIVLKFISWNEVTSEPSTFHVSTSGARIGKDAINEISVPSDLFLVPVGHSIIDYSKGHFHLSDNGYDFAASIRIGVGGVKAKWIVEDGCQFCAGSSIFRCLGLNDQNELHVYILEGPLKGEHRFISGQSLSGTTIGRSSESTISILDKELSRKHFSLQFDHGLDKYVLQDCGSTNGTYIQLVGPYKGKHRLSLNDHILVGSTGFSIDRYDIGVSEEIGVRQTMEVYKYIYVYIFF
jgi:hypothetical protein